jgi:hypothetical protein
MFDSRPDHVVIVKEVALSQIIILILPFSPVNTTTAPYTPTKAIIPATEHLSIARLKSLWFNHLQHLLDVLKMTSAKHTKVVKYITPLDQFCLIPMQGLQQSINLHP